MVLRGAYEEMKSFFVFTKLAPEKQEDTKFDENKKDFTTSSVANGAVSRGMFFFADHLQ